MAIIDLATLDYSNATLQAEVLENGTWVDPQDGETKPAYDLVAIRVATDSRIVKPRKQQGIYRYLIDDDALNLPGRRGEFMDKLKGEHVYSLSKWEQQLLRSKTQHGLPFQYQLAWEREIHGPQSPTFEQEVIATNTDNGATGITLTIVNPTSGNLLFAAHGVAHTASASDVSAVVGGGWTADRQYAGTATMGLSFFSRVSTGGEGTSLQFSQGASVQENSGYFTEVSGMVVTAGYQDGFDHVADNGANVTSRSSGSITTTVDDTLCFAAWSSRQFTGDLPTGSMSNSFVSRGFVKGAPSTSDHVLKVGSLVLASTTTIDSTWTITSPASLMSGMIGAYEIASESTPPSASVPTQTQRQITTVDSGVNQQIDIDPVPTVTAGTSAISSVRVYCTNGDLNVTLSGSVTITAGANNSSDLTLGNGASATEYNTVLATLKYTGDDDYHGEDTIHVIPSDGTLSDDESWVILVAPRGVKITSLTDNHDNIVAAFATMKGTLDAGQTTDDITVVVTDSGARTDSQPVTLMIGATAHFFAYVMRRRRRQ